MTDDEVEAMLRQFREIALIVLDSIESEQQRANRCE